VKTRVRSLEAGVHLRVQHQISDGLSRPARCSNPDLLVHEHHLNTCEGGQREEIGFVGINLQPDQHGGHHDPKQTISLMRCGASH